LGFPLTWAACLPFAASDLPSFISLVSYDEINSLVGIKLNSDFTGRGMSSQIPMKLSLTFL
jgi:hypothetical protein